MSTTSIAITGMRTSQLLISQSADNIANAATPGFKSNFSNLANIQDSNGVYSTTTNTMDIKGGFESTRIKGDLAIDGGKGYFIAKEKGDNGKVVNLVTGSFKPNKEGYLEYLNKYLLLGAKFNEDGSLPPYNATSLEPIFIDHNIVSKAKASSKITESFNLNSSLLAKGQGSFVLTPAAANRSANQNLNGYLIEGGDLVNGDSFAISIKEESNGQIFNKSLSCIFAGAKASTSYTDSDTTFPTAATDLLNITINGIPTAIQASDITGTNDGAKLADLQNKLSSLGIRTDLVKDTVAGTSQLIILPPSNSSDSLEISGTLATSLGITYNINPTRPGMKRFSSMSDLEQALNEGFNNIMSDNSSDSLVCFGKIDTNISFAQEDGSGNILKALGLEAGTLKGQGYNPYDASNNMASGKIRPDFSKAVTLYDSKGNSHLVTAALKKVEDGWIQELYFNDSQQIVSDRSDGLIQVTKFTFDNQGKLKGVSEVTPAIISASRVTSPFASLSPLVAGTAATISVNGTNFTLGTDFNNLAELAGAINQNPVTSVTVQATVISDGSNFKLKIIPINNDIPLITSSNLNFGINSLDVKALPSGNDEELIINFKPSENIERLSLNFDYNNIQELAFRDMNGLLDADGNAPAAMSDYSIDRDGLVTLNFTNGTQTPYYKIPLGVFANQNGLAKLGNNAYGGTATSGAMQIVDAGSGGSGGILDGTIESSNVEDATELANLIKNNKAYSMNTKSWQTGNELITTLLAAAS